jgi:hypothetical protein
LTRQESSHFLSRQRRIFGGRSEEIRELHKRRMKAFEAYEEKCEPYWGVGSRACPPVKSCGNMFLAFNNLNPNLPADPHTDYPYSPLNDYVHTGKIIGYSDNINVDSGNGPSGSENNEQKVNAQINGFDDLNTVNVASDSTNDDSLNTQN